MQLYGDRTGGIVLSLVTDRNTVGHPLVCDAIASVWGDYESLSVTDDDARNGLDGIGNLPAIYDSIHLRDPELVSSFINSFAGGGQLPPTVIIRASDTSLAGVVCSVAHDNVYRVLEYAASGVGSKKVRSDLKVNCGHAGDAFLRRLVQPEIFNYLKSALPKWTDEVWQYTRLDENYSFHVKAIVAVIAAAQLVHGLGIIEFSPSRIITWAMDELKSRIDEKSPVINPVAVVAEFLKEQMRNTIVVQHGWTNGRRTKLTPIIKPEDTLHIRYEIEEGYVFINKVVLNDWLRARGIDVKAVVSIFDKARVILHHASFKTLGGGTEFSNRQVVCYLINFRHPMVNGAFEPFNPSLTV